MGIGSDFNVSDKKKEKNTVIVGSVADFLFFAFSSRFESVHCEGGSRGLFCLAAGSHFDKSAKRGGMKTEIEWRGLAAKRPLAVIKPVAQKSGHILDCLFAA